MQSYSRADEGKTSITITDVAHASGVSNSAVSYALNGKKGVSAETRKKVLSVAGELGWKPNSAARALSSSKTRMVGLVLTSDSAILASESYKMELITGLGLELENSNYSLLIRRARGTANRDRIIKEWIATGAVDGILLMDIEMGDSRIGILEQHPEMPVLAMANPTVSGTLPALWKDDEHATELIMSYLHDHGHLRIFRVAGPEQLGHTRIRDRAFARVAAAWSMSYDCLHTDYSPAQAQQVTQRVVASSAIPSAIVYDSDAMALAGMSVVTAAGYDVPRDLSIISWDDSFMCTVVHPKITALSSDVVGTGAHAARMLLSLIDGSESTGSEETPYELVVRESSGDAPEN